MIVKFWEQPFRGGPTAAMIMDMGMKRLMKNEGLKVPGPWLHVIRALAKLPEEVQDEL